MPSLNANPPPTQTQRYAIAVWVEREGSSWAIPVSAEEALGSNGARCVEVTSVEDVSVRLAEA